MMISYSREAYGSASQWVEALRQDDAWLSQLQQLRNATAEDLSKHLQTANQRIEEGAARDFWYFYRHQVVKVVEELWQSGELTLPKLKILTIWMFTVEWIEQSSATTKGTILTTDEAKKYWLRLEKAGFVDANCALMPGTTRKQAMYIAEQFAERLGIKSKWKTFEELWSISNLAQEKWNMQETGSMPSRSKEIDMIFKD